MITNEQLVEFARSWLGAPYMYGNNGLVITEALIQAKVRQYPKQYTQAKIGYLRQKIGLKAVQCNSFTSILLNRELSADGWLSVATEKGAISDIPEIPGLTVHSDGHMGIYAGGGKVIEARGTYYGVVETRLVDRTFKTWAKMPGITYLTGVDIMLEKPMKDTIKGGNMGTAVTQWQKALEISGYEMKDDKGTVYPPDGSFGGATENATENFQREHALTVTGKVDLFTYSAMIENLLAIAADRLDKGELEKCRAIIADAMIILEKGVI